MWKIKKHFSFKTFPINSPLEVIHETKIILNSLLLPKINTTQTSLVSLSTRDTDKAPTSPSGEPFVELGLNYKRPACNAIKARQVY